MRVCSLYDTPVARPSGLFWFTHVKNKQAVAYSIGNVDVETVDVEIDACPAAYLII